MQLTTAYQKIARLDRRYRVIQGGMRAGKTFAILQYLVSLAESKPGIHITVCSNSLPSLRLGALKDFRHILKTTKHDTQFNENKTTNTFTCINNSVIEFVGLDEDLKARGASRDILFVNEANRIKYSTFDALAARTSEFIFLDYNPSSRFWVHDEIVGLPDTDFLVLTYKDNELIPPNIKDYIESKPRDSNWWRVYGLGEIGELEGNIFKGWKFVKQPLESKQLLGYGLDFGFRPDPCALTSLWQTDDSLYVQEEWLLYELTPNQIIEQVKKVVPSDALVVADNARPEIIQAMREAGIEVIECVKQEKVGGETVGKLGQLELMAEQHFICYGENLEKEYLGYRYHESRDGSFTSKIPDGDDHLLDSLRYCWYWHHRKSIIEKAMADILKEYSK